MKLKYLILLTFPLISCGNDQTNTAPIKSQIKHETPKAIPVSRKMTQMERGAKIYKRCKACHTLNEGGKHKVGPNLWAIYGQKAGSKEGFAYSKAMKASEVIWTNETMDGYIKKPSVFMKDNRMTFIGLKKQEDRDALQVYLKAKTGS